MKGLTGAVAVLATGGLLLSSCSIDLGTLGGFGSSSRNIGASGHVVGTTSLAGTGQNVGFIYEPSTRTMRPLTYPRASSVTATALLDAPGRSDPVVVGTAIHADGHTQAVAWSLGATEGVGFFPAPGYTSTSLNAITRDFYTAGTVSRPGEVPWLPDTQAGLWDSDGGFYLLGPLGDRGRFSSARDLNRDHVVVGQAWDGEGDPGVGFMWTGTGGMQALVGEGRSTFAHAVNDRGQIVGSLIRADSAQEVPAVWNAATGAHRTLPLPTGAANGFLIDVNNSGMAIGHAGYYGEDPRNHAFCVSLTSGTVTDLGTDVTLSAISEIGELAGTENGTAHLYTGDTCRA